MDWTFASTGRSGLMSKAASDAERPGANAIAASPNPIIATRIAMRFGLGPSIGPYLIGKAAALFEILSRDLGGAFSQCREEPCLHLCGAPARPRRDADHPPARREFRPDRGEHAAIDLERDLVGR